MNAPKSDTRSARRGIQSIHTGFRIIDYLVAVGQPVPLKQISEKTGLSSSKLQFYLNSFLDLGVVAQDRRSGHYGLGPYTLRLGIHGLQQFDVLAAATGRIRDFAEATGQSVYLGVWGPSGPTVVHRAEGAPSRSVFELRLGAVLPVLRSALGRLFLAHLPDHLTRPHIDRELTARDGAPHDAETPGTPEAVRMLAAEVRDRGISRCRGGLLGDHSALSAPVFDHTGRILAGVTIMGPTGSFDDSTDGPEARRLRAIAAAITKETEASVHHYLVS